jgi:hypothetical protein
MARELRRSVGEADRDDDLARPTSSDLRVVSGWEDDVDDEEEEDDVGDWLKDIFLTTATRPCARSFWTMTLSARLSPTKSM